MVKRPNNLTQALVIDESGEEKRALSLLGLGISIVAI